MSVLSNNQLSLSLSLQIMYGRWINIIIHHLHQQTLHSETMINSITVSLMNEQFWSHLLYFCVKFTHSLCILDDVDSWWKYQSFTRSPNLHSRYYIMLIVRRVYELLEIYLICYENSRIWIIDMYIIEYI